MSHEPSAINQKSDQNDTWNKIGTILILFGMIIAVGITIAIREGMSISE